MATIHVSSLVRQSLRLSWQRKALWIPAAGIPLKGQLFYWLSDGIMEFEVRHPHAPWSAVEWIANLLSYLVTAFLLVIVTHEALTVLQDGTVSLRRSLSRASSKLATIAGCGALLWIEEAVSLAAKDAARPLSSLLHLVGLAWGFSLYLVFPILSREEESGTAAILRAWHLIRRCWRQRLWGMFQLSLVIVLPATALFMVAFFSAFAGKPITPHPTFVYVWWLAISLISPFFIAADQLFDCALYLAVADDQPTQVPPVPQPQAA
jgi:hypothetical protein